MRPALDSSGPRVMWIRRLGMRRSMKEGAWRDLGEILAIEGRTARCRNLWREVDDAHSPLWSHHCRDRRPSGRARPAWSPGAPSFCLPRRRTRAPSAASRAPRRALARRASGRRYGVLSSLLSKLRWILGPHRLEGRSHLQLTLLHAGRIAPSGRDQRRSPGRRRGRPERLGRGLGAGEVAQHITARGFFVGEDAPWIDERRWTSNPRSALVGTCRPGLPSEIGGASSPPGNEPLEP